jgi:hypothetical protein
MKNNEFEKEVFAMLRPDPTQELQSSEPPKTRELIDRAKNIGMAGVGVLAAIPTSLAKMEAKQKTFTVN